MAFRGDALLRRIIPAAAEAILGARASSPHVAGSKGR